MPPTGSEPPTHKQQLTLENWIEYSGFAVDPANLDPGRQTVRRLNRTEYHNTVQDLIGVDYDTDANFPADDIGYGFDNIGDVLNVSQMLMEKYMSAAQTIVMQVVPQVPRVMPVVVVQGTKFSDTPSTAPVATGRGPGGGGRGPGGGSLDLSFFTDSKTTHTFKVAAEGDYKIVVDKDIRGQFGFNSARCTVTYSEDDEQLLTNEYGWKEDDAGSDEISRDWMPGSHHFTITLHPTVPPAKTDPPRPLSFRVLKVQLQGPMDESKWNPTPGYDKFFTHGKAPADPVQRSYTSGNCSKLSPPRHFVGRSRTTL